jgi:pyruvate dehydrogenase E2 component (dihydrolipoamide acetyltransferase)
MAQLTIAQEVDASDCERLRAQLQQLWGAERPSHTALVVRAAALALREHPHVNAIWEQDRLVLEPQINIGLAVDAPEGLIVPVLRGADRLGLRELAEQVRAVGERARANQVRPEELQGGTFSVTTLGALGIDFFTPIVNPPQVSVLGIGRVFSKLALVGERVAERSAMYLSLSFDHRALDGAPAARFLNRVKSLLELPVALL